LTVAREYHRATDVPAGGTDEDEARMIGARPRLFKEYGDRERVALEASVAGPLLRDGAGIVRSQPRRDYGGGTIHWRGYSSAGALYPVEAYVAAPDGLYSFDALGRSLVRLADGDARPALAEAAAADELAAAGAVVVLTGIHARTGWKYLERGYRHVWWDAGTMLANLLALAAADDLAPRLYTGFVDAAVNRLLTVDGVHEYALALLAVGGGSESGSPAPAPVANPAEAARRFPLAERLHEASSLVDAGAVRDWRGDGGGEEPKLPRDELARAIRRRGSVRRYAPDPLPRDELAALLDWSEASIPADAPPVVRQRVTVAAVDGLAAGIYDTGLELVAARDERELRVGAGFAAMEQDHPRLAAANVFQLADLDAVVDRLGERGYRWAQLEAGIRAGRLQVGAFMRGWGAAASTFFDAEVSRLLGTREAPMLMVAIGPRARAR
jgi:SagB-type dehydrogenase family enzyme